MKTRRPFLSLAAALAAALTFTLAGCGGGNAEPPPDNTITDVAPVVPVVTITNNVAAEVATGDITFTFSFNVDVGTSFTADDVAVTGGTAGAFTRVDGKSATLVVAPLSNTTGMVEVAVPAGAVTDAAGTPNEAVSALKAFDTTAVAPPPGGTLTFSSGLAQGARTVEGGEFGGFSGSDQDGFNCSGDPAWCGGGGAFTPDVAAADSYFYYYYQTPTPASALYAGIYVQAPGVTGGLSGTADTPGLQLAGQTTMKFNFNPNPEWFNSGTNNFMVQLDMGKLYLPSGNACHIQLRRVVTPTSVDSTLYTLDLSSFVIVQDCAVGGLTTASVLSSQPIAQVSFQAAGGGAAVTDGSLTTGANLSVAANGVYPTTLVIKGAITFEP
jgi:hypothetical protein